MEPSGASEKRVSVLECGQSSAAFASRTVPRLRKIPFAIRAFRISPTEDVALGIDARRSHAHCQSGRGLPALQDADATAEPFPIFRALPSSSNPNWSLLQPTSVLDGKYLYQTLPLIVQTSLVGCAPTPGKPSGSFVQAFNHQHTRLHCGRAVGAERLSPTGRFIGSLRRACPESVEGISRGVPYVLISRHGIGTADPSCDAVSFESGDWWQTLAGVS